MENISVEENYLTRLMQLYRVQRHDFLNHFQVAMGYLQLGKSQQALDYLRQAAAEAISTAPLSRARPPELAVELMGLASACFTYGIGFYANLTEDLPEIKWLPVYGRAMELIRRLVPGSRQIELELTSSGSGIWIEIKFTGLTKEQLGNCIGELVTLGFKADELGLPERVGLGLNLPV